MSNEISQSREPIARLVLLGASNLTRAISTVIESARLAFGGPLEVFAALGHGRSYGMYSRVVGRGYPSILSCGLWNALEQSRTQRPHLRTYALITDIGNDVMYGAPPTVIDKWVEQCIERIQHDPHACITLTRLPIQSISALRPWQYAIVKTAFFPTRKLSYSQAIKRGNDLYELINDLGARRQATLIDLPGSWYGFDPVHIRMKHWRKAWGSIMCSCANVEFEPQRGASWSLARWIRIKTLTPQHWWLLGRELRRTQPVGKFADGTTISMF